MNNTLTINSVVFAGGGCRCFWQLGFWDTAATALNLKPKVFAGVSAGAAMAVTINAGRSQFLLDYFKKLTAANKKNFYPGNLFTRTPAFPQNRMYREAITRAYEGEFFKKALKGPEIKVLLSRAPGFLGARIATLIGLGAYSIEKIVTYPVHSRLASKMGYKPEVVPVSKCASPDELVDLVLQSSCTPPFVPIMRRDNRIVLDGGLVDNVPVAALDESEKTDMLLLLTRVYPENKIPKVPGWTYVQPSEKIPIEKADYSNPVGLQKAFDLGRKDGEAFAKKYK